MTAVSGTDLALLIGLALCACVAVYGLLGVRR